MSALERHYTDDEREAVGRAYVELEIRPASRVGELAAAGRLTRPDGSRLPAFRNRDGAVLTAAQVRSIARDHRRRNGKAPAPGLADKAPRDAIEALRRELVTAAERGLAAIRRAQDESDGRLENWEELRQAIRCVREAAALPGPTDPRPSAPGTGPVEERPPGDSQTRGGRAGALLQAHRAGTLPVPAQATPEPEPPPPDPEPDEGANGQADPDGRADLVAVLGDDLAAELERLRADAPALVEES